MIVIEPFVKPNNPQRYLHFEFDSLSELYLLDELLAERYEIIMQDGHTFTVVYRENY